MQLQRLCLNAFSRIILEGLLMVSYEHYSGASRNGGRSWLRSLCTSAWMKDLNMKKSVP